jgi:hypothetical protein
MEFHSGFCYVLKGLSQWLLLTIVLRDFQKFIAQDQVIGAKHATLGLDLQVRLPLSTSQRVAAVPRHGQQIDKIINVS